MYEGALNDSGRRQRAWWESSVLIAAPGGGEFALQAGSKVTLVEGLLEEALLDSRTGYQFGQALMHGEILSAIELGGPIRVGVAGEDVQLIGDPQALRRGHARFVAPHLSLAFGEQGPVSMGEGAHQRRW